MLNHSSPIELSIIIVNWNGSNFLTRSVQSVINFPPSAEYEVVIVDNASTDDSLAHLRASEAGKLLTNRGRLRIIENTENRGFAAANNQGFAATQTPLLFLLNPDAEITANCIDRLMQTVSSDSRIGAAGPRILNADGSLQISVWRNPPAAWNIILSNLKLYSVLPQNLRGELLLGGHWDHNRERAVPMLGGAAMLVRRNVIEKVGGFDERFHMYGEDHDWCFRINRAGWLLIFQPEAIVIHQGAWCSLQRWTNLEKIRVQLEAHYLFQTQSLSRGRILANSLAYCLTLSTLHLWRRMRKIDAPQVKLALDVYWEHLKRTLRNNHSS